MNKSLENFKPSIMKKSLLQVSIPNSKTSASLLFVFEIQYDNKKIYKWLIQRTYSDFSLFAQTVEKQFLNGAIDQPPSFMNNLVLAPENYEQIFMILESYLQKLVLVRGALTNPQVLEFFEVSALSFDGTSEKRKEGYVMKRTGGRINNEKLCCNLSKYFKRLQKRWVILKDNMIGYLTNNTKDALHEVIMFKGRFEIKSGTESTGFDDGVLISTNRRNLLFRAGNFANMNEWVKAINEAYKQSEWKNSLVRFESSFPIRNGNLANWFVDGQDYFNEVYNSLLNAKHEVFISDWWLSPELYLKRPSTDYPESSVVEVLGSLADKGVQVYVHVYKEVSLALSLNSLHTKKMLINRNSNIKVVRHPHRSVVGSQFLWSHHEKIVCIDQELAFIGGLDLCFGRMDSHSHSLTDTTSPHTWPGIDYSNVRVCDFTNVADHSNDLINRFSIPRLPWHDVSLKLSGKAARDIALHFIELWNHVMTDISSDYWKNKDLIRPKSSSIFKPVQIDTILQYADQENPKATQNPIKVVGLSKSFAINRFDALALDHLIEEPEVQPVPVKVFSNESTTWITNTKQNKQKFTFSKSIDHKDLDDLDELMFKHELEADIKQGDEFWARNLLLPKIEESNKNGTCQCQVVRSAGPWSLGLDKAEHSIHSAYLHLIEAADHFIYIENQFFISSTAGKPVRNNVAMAILERVKIAASLKQKFRVIVVMPLLPGFEGRIESSSILKAQLHWEYSSICRGIASIVEQLKNDRNIDNVDEYISFYSLRTHALLDGVPVTEMVYVHSKLMIVDDKFVILGSANINDRSMLGHRDSEIAVVIKDKKKVESIIDGQNVLVRDFAYSLRIKLFQEFTQCDDLSILQDPLSQNFWNFWKTTAENNTFLYRHVFRCLPDDAVHKIEQISEFERGNCFLEYDKLRNGVRGFLVMFPLEFLKDESLKISIFDKEYLLPEENFV